MHALELPWLHKLLREALPLLCRDSPTTPPCHPSGHEFPPACCVAGEAGSQGRVRKLRPREEQDCLWVIHKRGLGVEGEGDPNQKGSS